MPLPIGLECLPTELIEQVGDHFGDKDLAHHGQGNRFLNRVFPFTLVKRSLEDKPSIVKIPALTWAIKHGYKYLVKRILSNNYGAGRASDALCNAAALGHCGVDINRAAPIFGDEPSVTPI